MIPAGLIGQGPALAGEYLPAARPQAAFSPHALLPREQRVHVYDALLPGETLAAYFERTGLVAAIAGAPVRVTVDGAYVPRDMWRFVRPKPGTFIGVTAVVQGGGGGKNPLASILTIAMFFFPPSGFLLSAATAGTQIIGSLTIGKLFDFAVGLVVTALFAPPKPQLSQAQGANNLVDSPTYALSGGSNRARPWEPLPIICGTHRFFFDLGAATYTEFQGEDAYLYQVFCAGYNTITLSDYKIGATALSSYSGVTMEESGTDGALDLFPGNVDTIGGGTMDYNVYLQRTSSFGVTGLAVEIVGNSFAVNTEGVIQGAAYAWTIEYRAIGSATWLPFVGASATVAGQGASGSRKPLRRTFKLDVALGQYEVRVSSQTDINAFTNPTQYTIEFNWTQLRSYQPDTADYTGQQRVAMMIKASGQLSGQVQQLSAIARAQCLVWNGSSWVLGETSNPAWWFRALALGRFVTIGGRSVRVWGAGLASTRVDDASIKAWGAWCDSKSLTFNAIFDRAMSAADMLQAVATCGRASMSWANGKLGVVYDQASQPITAVFGMSNIIAGSFQIGYQTEQLADELIVGFINPDLDWQRDSVRCLVPGVTTPTRTRNIELFGCTNLDMAGRAGNLYAAQQAYRTRTYKWQTDFEGMPCSRGDVVQLSHDLASFDYSGRLVEGSNTTTLKLERQVPLAAGGTYVVLVKPDQTFATYAVTGGSGNTDTLTLVTALGFNPGTDPDHVVYDYKWLYGATATPGRKVKIDSLKPMDESTVEITAIDELDAFYLAEDADYVYNPPRPTFGSPMLSNLTVTEDGVRVANGYLVALLVSWDAGTDYAGAEVWAAIDGGPELHQVSTTGRSASFTVNDGAVAVIRVVATSSLGVLGEKAELSITHTTEFAGTAPPHDVSTFLLDDDVLSWLPVDDADVAGYHARFNYGTNADWGGAAALHQGLLTASPWQMPIRPAGPVTLMIKAVDVAGIESDNPAIIYTDLGAAPTQKIVEAFNLKALGFPGTITAGSISGGNLVADSTTLAWAGADENAFWGAADSGIFWPATSYAAMTYEAQVTPTKAYTGAQMTIAATITAGLYGIEYRPDGPQTFWSANTGDVFWGSDTATFWPDPPDYQPWPGSLAVTGQPYDLRITTSGGGTQGVISALEVDINVPIISERLNDVVIAATTGTRLTLTKTYQGIDNVQLTVQTDGNGAIGALLQDKSTAGPLVLMVNNAGGNPAGLIDAFVQGYAP